MKRYLLVVVCCIFGIPSTVLAQTVGQWSSDPVGMLQQNLDSNPPCSRCDLSLSENVSRGDSSGDNSKESSSGTDNSSDGHDDSHSGGGQPGYTQ